MRWFVGEGHVKREQYNENHNIFNQRGKLRFGVILNAKDILSLLVQCKPDFKVSDDMEFIFYLHF